MSPWSNLTHHHVSRKSNQIMCHLRTLHWLPRTLRRKSKLLHYIKNPAWSGLSLLQNLILYNVLFYSLSLITSWLCWHNVFACCVPTLEYSSNKCMHVYTHSHIHTAYTSALCTWLDSAHFSWLNFSVTSSAKSFVTTYSEYFFHP